MDYFQGVVAEYLRADRGVFLNPECLLQLEPGAAPPKGTCWYCDIVAANMKEETLYLCEVSYSESLNALVARLNAWAAVWPRLRRAIGRDCGIPSNWTVQPWAFIPGEIVPTLTRKLPAWPASDDPKLMPYPRVTLLEDVLPWRYCTWDRQDDALASISSVPTA